MAVCASMIVLRRVFVLGAARMVRSEGRKAVSRAGEEEFVEAAMLAAGNDRIRLGDPLQRARDAELRLCVPPRQTPCPSNSNNDLP